MNENRTIRLAEVPIGGNGGSTWNRLHADREDICEALVKGPDHLSDERRQFLQKRLRSVDDALDRLMSGSYGKCSKCGSSIDEAKLDIDPTFALCRDCGRREPGAVAASEICEIDSNGEVSLESLHAFDTIAVQTQNSNYYMLLLDPKTGRTLVEGGNYLGEPSEAFLRGSVVPGAFRSGSICVGGRLEMWVEQRVFLTSAVKAVNVKHNGTVQPVEDFSTALH